MNLYEVLRDAAALSPAEGATYTARRVPLTCDVEIGVTAHPEGGGLTVTLFFPPFRGILLSAEVEASFLYEPARAVPGQQLTNLPVPFSVRETCRILGLPEEARWEVTGQSWSSET